MKENLGASIIGYLFLDSNHLKQKMDQFFKPYGITLKQWLLLASLRSIHDDGAKLTDLSNTLGTTYQNTKKIVVILEKEGYLNVHQDALDKRALNITLTAKTDSLFETLDPYANAILSNLFEPYDIEELKTIHQFLQTFINVIDDL
jgi:DNA-binding MarR family transcriptional regulator